MKCPLFDEDVLSVANLVVIEVTEKTADISTEEDLAEYYGDDIGFQVGSEVIVKCRPGFLTEGVNKPWPRRMRCEEDGQWSGGGLRNPNLSDERQACKPIPCWRPPRYVSRELTFDRLVDEMGTRLRVPAVGRNHATI